MGSSSTKTRLQSTVPPKVSGYPPPAPPLYYIDDIKTPISCYNLQRTIDDDGLDWSEILDKIDGEQEWFDQRPRQDPVYHQNKTETNVKQPPPSTKRPIRSITLLGRERTGHPATSKQSHDTTSLRRTPSLKRRSTPGAFTNKKLDFAKIDSHAERASEAHRRSYESLLEYLVDPVRGTDLQDITTARLLVSWLAYQPIKKTFTKPNNSTPQGLLQMVANGTMSYAAAYTTLCRAAGLQCVLIEGVSKPYTYTPSDSVTPDMDDIWTAVHCEDSWQFVHPDRICKTQDETLKREYLLTLLLDDLFMPAPEYFIHTCYPDEEAWQLLPHECVVKSRKAFLQLPCIFPPFFKLGLKLESDSSSVITTSTGKCEIDFNCSHKNDNRMSLISKLTMAEVKPGSKSKDQKVNFNNFVLHARQSHKFHIEVKPPSEGTYKLELFQCFYGRMNLRLCNFTLIITEAVHSLTHLPFSPKHMMWGPGHMCDEGGLLVPSQMVGIVVIAPKNIIDRRSTASAASNYQTSRFMFILQPEKTKNTDMLAYLRRSSPVHVPEIGQTGAKRKPITTETDESSFYSDFVTCERNEDKHTLAITVVVPHDGEFGLLITKRHFHLDKNKMKVFDGDEVAVCAYLLRASRKAHGDNAHQRLARDNMVSLIYGEDQVRLRDAIDKCRKVNIDVSDGDIYSAETWAEYLKHKTNLNDSLHRRTIRHIDNTLTSVSTFRYKTALQFKIKRVFQVRHQLVQLRELKKYEPTLKRAAMELATVPLAEAPLHVTMAAVLMMFGEIDKKVEDWSYIRKQLEVTEGKQESTLLGKIHRVDEICPSKSAIKKTVSLLTEYNEAQVRASSLWASCFNNWAMKVLSVFDESIVGDAISLPDSTDIETTHAQQDVGHTEEPSSLRDDRVDTLYNESQDGEMTRESQENNMLAVNTVYSGRNDSVVDITGHEDIGIQTGRDDIGIQTD